MRSPAAWAERFFKLFLMGVGGKKSKCIGKMFAGSFDGAAMAFSVQSFASALSPRLLSCWLMIPWDARICPQLLWEAWAQGSMSRDPAALCGSGAGSAFCHVLSSALGRKPGFVGGGRGCGFDLCQLLAIVHFNLCNGPGSCGDGRGLNKCILRPGDRGQRPTGFCFLSATVLRQDGSLQSWQSSSLANGRQG